MLIWHLVHEVWRRGVRQRAKLSFSLEFANRLIQHQPSFFIYTSTYSMKGSAEPKVWSTEPRSNDSADEVQLR